MLKVEWTEDDVDIEKLAAQPPVDFVCPRKEQTDYLLNSAWGDQKLSVAVTYLLTFGEVLVGYVALTMDEIPLAKVEKPEGIAFSRLPAMKIAQMGVHNEWSGNGFGQYLVTFAIAVALELKERVGCRYVTLDSKTDLVEWYRKQGFVCNERDHEERVAVVEALKMSARKRVQRLAELPISMRLDLQGLEN